MCFENCLDTTQLRLSDKRRLVSSADGSAKIEPERTIRDRHSDTQWIVANGWHKVFYRNINHAALTSLEKAGIIQLRGIPIYLLKKSKNSM